MLTPDMDRYSEGFSGKDTVYFYLGILRNVQDMVEQNDNSFDDVINNVKVEPAAGTLEIVSDDKKSVLEKLKEQSPQEQKELLEKGEISRLQYEVNRRININIPKDK